MCGGNIQSPTDQLKKVDEERIYRGLVAPKPQIASTIERLRTIYSLDAARYAALKRKLPYIVCGMFNPAFRRTENFAYTESFILDFDHLAEKQLNLAALRAKIAADNRVALCFASPSLDGLKVMFHLRERCYDSGLYSIFYKAFAAKFARDLNLEQVIDSRTSDATRACFMSIDPDAYFNRQAEAVDLKAYVDEGNPLATFDMKHSQAKEEKEQKAAAKPATPRPHDPTSEAMAKIRQKLRPGAPAVKKDTYVPPQLDDIIDALKDYIMNTGIGITEIDNIQYGKKIHARLGMRQAEVNLFYGKRGYSAVISPKRGTDNELNNLLADVVQSFLYDPTIKVPI